MKTIMCIVVLAAVASSLPAGTFVPNEEELLEVANNLPSDEEASHEEDPKADALMRAREAKDPEFDFLQNMMAHADEAKTPEVSSSKVSTRSSSRGMTSEANSPTWSQEFIARPATAAK